MHPLLSGLLLWTLHVAPDAPEAAWSPPWRSGEVTMEKRAVAGSALPEFRVTTQSPLSPAALCGAAFDMTSVDQRNPDVHFTRILSDQPDERVVYNQVSHAFVSNRDYAMTVTRTHQGEDDCSVAFRITNEKAPPQPAGFLRMAHLHGNWHFAREGDHTLIVHTLFVDPSGAIPPFLIQGEAQKSAEQGPEQLYRIVRERRAPASNR